MDPEPCKPGPLGHLLGRVARGIVERILVVEDLAGDPIDKGMDAHRLRKEPAQMEEGDRTLAGAEGIQPLADWLTDLLMELVLDLGDSPGCDRRACHKRLLSHLFCAPD